MKTAIRILSSVFLLAVLFAAPNRVRAAGPSLIVVGWGDTLAAIGTPVITHD
jgi:dolichol kinase